MRSERIGVRVTDEFKKKIEIIAKKEKKTISQFVYDIIVERIENENLTDSQGQFIKLFDMAFERSFKAYFNKQMLVLNKNNFNSEWIIETIDLFMKHLKIPQTKDEVKTSFVKHPITEIAHGKVVKNIRSMSANKKENEEDEYE